jgi:hypothetical protein
MVQALPNAISEKEERCISNPVVKSRICEQSSVSRGQ